MAINYAQLLGIGSGSGNIAQQMTQGMSLGLQQGQQQAQTALQQQSLALQAQRLDLENRAFAEKQAAAAQNREAMQAYTKDVAIAMLDNTIDEEEWKALSLRHPMALKLVKDMESFSGSQDAKKDFKKAMPIFQQLNIGNKEGALTELDAQIEGAKKSGDEQTFRALTGMRQIVAAEGDLGMQTVKANMMATMLARDPDFGKKLGQINEAQLKAYEAKHGDAAFRLKNEKTEAEIAKLKAEADAFAIKAKSGALVGTELEQKATLKLTELKQKYEQQFDVKRARAVLEANQKIQGAKQDGFSVLQAVTSFTQAIDPGVSVKESDIANAMRAAGFKEGLIGLVQSAVTAKGPLSQKALSMLKGETKRITDIKLSQAAKITRQFRSILKSSPVKYFRDQADLAIDFVGGSPAEEAKKEAAREEAALESIKGMGGRVPKIPTAKTSDVNSWLKSGGW